MPRCPRTPLNTQTFSAAESECFEKKTTFVEKDQDFSFITQRNSKAKPRIIEHPAPTNPAYHEYRFCHPTQPRSRIMNATFSELKQTLNAWTPYGDNDSSKYSSVSFDLDDERDILQKSLLDSENLRHMKLIKVSETENKKLLKVVIFDVTKQIFLLRTSLEKEECKEHYPKPLKNPSQHPEWCVDLSTLLSSGEFWSELKVLINSM